MADLSNRCCSLEVHDAEFTAPRQFDSDKTAS